MMTYKLIWFIDGYCLKNEEGKFCARYAVSAIFQVSGAALFHSAASVQQAELYAVTQCVLAKGKMASIYTDSW